MLFETTDERESQWGKIILRTKEECVYQSKIFFETGRVGPVDVASWIINIKIIADI